MAKGGVLWLDRRIAAPGPFLTLCLTEEQLRQACNGLRIDVPKFFNLPGSGGSTFSFVSPRGLACIVAIRNLGDKTPVEVAGLLVHEAVHVWQQYADDIGERHPGAEQEAYAIQAVAQELMQEYARQISHHPGLRR